MKRCVYLLLVIVLTLSMSENVKAQEISPLFFGQNSWMPDSTGTRFLNGKVHETWPLIKESGAQIIRFGGISSDRDMPTNYQYLRMVDSIRNNGMEPIIQVSFWKESYSAEQAAALVKFLNVTHNKNIKYWSIGNEPDHGSSYGYTKASQVAPYLKKFASAMKDADPSIKIIGPDCAWYNRNIINDLTSPNGPYDVTGMDSKGRYYIDIISFHEYPFKGDQSRNQVISNLTSGGKFETKLKELKDRIKNCNSKHGRTGPNELKMAVTEANVGYKDPSTDGINGVGTESFIGGQFWAEIMGIGMKHGLEFLNFWGVTNAFGYLEKDTHKKRPSFHHFKMLADNFRGTYCDGTSSVKEVKSFGSKDGNQIVVIVMNQSNSKDHKFSINLNNQNPSGSDVKIKINAGTNKQYDDEIVNQSTLLLTFDNSGNLIRKCEYRLKGHADQNKGPECKSFTPAPEAQITAESSVICDGGSVTLNANTGEGITYQWFRNSNKIEGAKSASYITSTSGSYTVTIKKGESGSTSEPFEVVTGTVPIASTEVSGSLNICMTHSVLIRASTGVEYEYQWTKDGEVISGENAYEYMATVPGTYNVIVSSPCGTSTSSAIIVTTCEGVSGMGDQDENSLYMNTYPNPSVGLFTVEVNVNDMPDEMVNLEVFNITGQLVYQIRPNCVNGYVREQVDMGVTFSPGVYIVRVSAGDLAYTNKVMVSR
jgi:hypothetical protein